MEIFTSCQDVHELNRGMYGRRDAKKIASDLLAIGRSAGAFGGLMSPDGRQGSGKKGFIVSGKELQDQVKLAVSVKHNIVGVFKFVKDSKERTLLSPGAGWVATSLDDVEDLTALAWCVLILKLDTEVFKPDDDFYELLCHTRQVCDLGHESQKRAKVAKRLAQREESARRDMIISQREAAKTSKLVRHAAKKLRRMEDAEGQEEEPSSPRPMFSPPALDLSGLDEGGLRSALLSAHSDLDAIKFNRDVYAAMNAIHAKREKLASQLKQLEALKRKRYHMVRPELRTTVMGDSDDEECEEDKEVET